VGLETYFAAFTSRFEAFRTSCIEAQDWQTWQTTLSHKCY